jgi:DNA polymerase-3 subunit gamma/tau
VSQAVPYRVLARKYRPADFSALIGQEGMVRTLTNAIQSGRLAHAFMLTGVRGVGKTTTARIIARALNCIGPDGGGGPTATPCGVCEHCRSIAEDRHVDVIEMDAASHTGVDGIRDLLDGVRYLPTSARFKIYIIDEVHMLSDKAFNALLKTLEEPPEHVKFIFATTEIRKIPVTVLSRCQRFDLRRVPTETLERHFARVAEQEKVVVAPEAIALIARAADGSVRDGLSMLDQAIAHGGGQVSAEQVRDMLGLADRIQVFDLFEAVMKGDIAAALDRIGIQYAMGIDPGMLIADLLDLTHWVTRVKLAPAGSAEPGVAEAERERGRQLAGALSMASLTRAWQMLLKGLNEVRGAPSPLQAAEMTLVRLAYAAELPTPAEAIEQIRGRGPASPSASAASPLPSPLPMSSARHATEGSAAIAHANPAPAQRPSPADPVAVARSPTGGALVPVPGNFPAMVELLASRREALLAAHLSADVHLVSYEPGRLEFRAEPAAPGNLATRLSRLLSDWTGRAWMVSLSHEVGAPTLREQALEREIRRREDAAALPLVQAILTAFPGATIGSVRDLTGGDGTAGSDDSETRTTFDLEADADSGDEP